MIPITKLTGRLGNQMFQYAYLYDQARRGNIRDIYLQDEKYFYTYAEEIRSIYATNIPTTNPYVSIHVRRGDYDELRHFYVDLLQTGYYEKAMKVFPEHKFLVFSDDITFCKKQDIFKGCEFSEGRTEIEDMNLMASCEHNIIANSSFSWWGAWINPNKDKQVVAPREWFTQGALEAGAVPVGIPNTWIKI